MRHVTTPRILVLEKAAHHKACAWIAHVVLPVAYRVAKFIEFALLKAHGGIKVVDVLLGHLVHIAEAGEAVVPRNLACLVKHQATLRASTIFELPSANGTAVDAVFAVTNDVERGARWIGGRVEQAFEQASGSRVGVVTVFLDSIGVVLLPLPVIFEGLARRKEVGSRDEDGGHVSDLQDD